MSDHSHAFEPESYAEPEHHIPAEHPHPTALGYIKIGAILAVITIVEVAVYYMEAVKPVLPWLLVALSALKFGMVAAFFMHLKFDDKLFTALFVGGLAIAASVVLALMTLFGTWAQVPIVHPGAH